MYSKPYVPKAILKGLLSFLREHYLATGALPRINEVPVEVQPALVLIDSFEGLILEWEVFRFLKAQGVQARYDVDADCDKGIDLYVLGQPVQISTYDKGLHESGLHYLVLPGFIDSLTAAHESVIKSLVLRIRAATGMIRVATVDAVEAKPAESPRPKRKRSPNKNSKVTTYTLDQITKEA